MQARAVLLALQAGCVRRFSPEDPVLKCSVRGDPEFNPRVEKADGSLRMLSRGEGTLTDRPPLAWMC